jgi:hypothetical protein
MDSTLIARGPSGTRVQGMLRSALWAVLLLAALALAACGGGKGGGGGPRNTLDLHVSVRFPGGSSGQSQPLLTKAPWDVLSLGVRVTRTDSGNPVLDETALTYNGDTSAWEGTLTGLPTGVSLDLRANAYDGLSFTGNVLFTDLVTQSLTPAGPNTVTFNMAAIDLGPGAVPIVQWVSMPGEIGTGTTGNLIQISIAFGGPVNYYVQVTNGTLNGSGLSYVAGQFDPTGGGTLDVYYDAPASGTSDLLYISLADPASSTSFAVTYPIVLSELASAPVQVNFGPFITGLNFSRSATQLTIGMNVGGTAPLTFSWSGTGSFAGLGGAYGGVTINPFDDSMSGDVIAQATDANGISATVTHYIAPGAFPYNLILGSEAPAALQGTWEVCRNDYPGVESDYIERFDISGWNFAVSTIGYLSGDSTCSGTPGTPAEQASGTYSVGSFLPATFDTTTVTARELDAVFGGPRGPLYTIYYVDTAAVPPVMYFGDDTATPGLDGTSPAARPTILQAAMPRQKVPGTGFLYDDFAAPVVDTTKWSLHTSASCTPVVTLDSELETQQTFTGSDDNCGVDFPIPNAVGWHRFDVNVTDFQQDQGYIRARAMGIYFSSIPTPTPGDTAGDVLAVINISYFDPLSHMGSASWTIAECTSGSQCQNVVTLGSEWLGTVSLNEVHTIGIGWNGGTVFTFKLDHQNPVTVDTFALYGKYNFGPPMLPTRQVRSRGTGVPLGQMTVRYDNVYCATVSGQACPTTP